MLLILRREREHQWLRTFQGLLTGPFFRGRRSVDARLQTLLIGCPIYHHMVRGLHDCTVVHQGPRAAPPLVRSWPVHVFAVRS